MGAVNGMTGKDNAENLAKVREAMAQAQTAQTANVVQLGGAMTYQQPVDYTATSGVTYRGIIEFKRTTAKDLMRIGGLKAEYFREAGIQDLSLADPSVRLLAHILAYLKVVVVKSPEWFFNVDTIEDVDVLYEVYELYRKWEDSFRKPVPSGEAENSEASEGTEAMDA